jgi:AcrR family transcriptional regulator
MKKNNRPCEGLRQRKRRETRAALSQTTIRLCMQRGWENVTVEDIAEAANVSPRTFRNYFSTKAEAVAAAHLERMLRIADSLRASPAGEDIWTAITNSVATQFEPPVQKSGSAADVRKWLDRIRFLFTEPAIRGEVLKAATVAQNELAKAIADRIQGKRVGDMYPELTSAVVVAVVGVVQERWLHDGPNGSIVPLLRSAFKQVAAGLPEKGAAVIGR